jgi:hypothetical protein
MRFYRSLEHPCPTARTRPELKESLQQYPKLAHAQKKYTDSPSKQQQTTQRIEMLEQRFGFVLVTFSGVVFNQRYPGNLQPLPFYAALALLECPVDSGTQKLEARTVTRKVVFIAIMLVKGQPGVIRLEFCHKFTLHARRSP